MSVQQIDKIWSAGGINRYDTTTNPSGWGDPVNVIQYFEISTDSVAHKASTCLLIPRGYGTANINAGTNLGIFSGGGDLNLRRQSDVLQTNLTEVIDFTTDTGYVRSDARLTYPRVGHQGATV